MLLRSEVGQSKARLTAELMKDGKGYKLRVTNVSTVPACNVSVRTISADHDPLIDSEKQSKLPWPRLDPGASFTLIAVIYLSSPTAFNMGLTWSDPDGTVVEEEAFVAL